MTGFFVAIAVIISLLVMPVLLAARRAFVVFAHADSAEIKTGIDARRNSNILAYKQQLVILDAQLASTEIDQATHAQLGSEAKRQLLQEAVDNDDDISSTSGLQQLKQQRVIVFVATLAIPIVALLVYLPSGYSLGYLDQLMVVEKMKQVAGSENREQAINEVLETAEQHVRTSRADPQLLYLLANIYRSQGRYNEAIHHLERLLRKNENADTLAMLVELQYMQHLRQQQVASSHSERGEALFTPDMQQRLTRALQLSPDHPEALSLSGIFAFRSGHYQRAVEFWQKALGAYSPMSAEARTLQDSIKAAQRRAGQATDTVQATATATALIKLRVSIDKSQLANDDPATPVFVFARPVTGPKMPLAARKLTLADLPLEIVLTNNDAMAGLSIADVDQVQVGARLARSGQPAARAGDLESAVQTLPVHKLGSNGITHFDDEALTTIKSLELHIDTLYQ